MLLDDPQYAKRIGSRAREFVLEKFDWSVIAPRVAALANIIVQR